MTKEPPAAGEHRFELVAECNVEPGTRVFYFVPGLGVSAIWRAVEGDIIGAEPGSVHLEHEFQVNPALPAAQVRSALPKLNLTSAKFRAGLSHELDAKAEKALMKALKGRLEFAPEATGLLSLTLGGDTVERLSIQAIKRSLHGAYEITLMSAFVDPDLLTALFDGIAGARKATLRLIFDAREVTRRRSERSGNQTHSPIDQALAGLHRRFGRVEIGVMSPDRGGIFHSKLLISKVRTDQGERVTTFIGSANATMRAMSSGNEEVLLRIDGASVPGLLAYVEKVVAHSSDMDSAPRPATGLAEFMLRGTLYFKPTNPLKLTYNPFSDFLAELEPEERRMVSANDELPDAEPGTGLIAFDLERALRALGRLPPETKERAQGVWIKSFAIETCYGYWVPAGLVHEFEAQLEAPRAAKELRLRSILTALSEDVDDAAPDADLMKRYTKYLETASTWAKDRGLDPDAVLRRMDEPVGPFHDTAGFERFVQGLVRQLSNDAIMERRSTAFLAGPMPDLRMDRLVESEFTESFFEYVAYATQRDKPSRVVKAIMRRARHARNLGPDPEPEAIKEAFKASLQATAWADSEWPS